MDELGHRIRAARLASGLKQLDLAEAAGISPSYLALIEGGRRTPGEALLARLAATLGRSPAAITETLDPAHRAAVGALATAPGEAEVEPPDALIRQFPGWAARLAGLSADLRDRDAHIARMSDRLRHDPRLADTLHELLSAATALSTAATIVADDDLDPHWRRRFLRNIGEDAARLKEGAASLADWLDSDGAAARPPGAPPLEIERQADLRALVEAPEDGSADPILRRFRRDAAAMPVLADDADPVAAAGAADLDPCLGLRRAAVLRGAGLVLDDGSGVPRFARLPDGFPVPRAGESCAVWPLHQAAPGRVVRAVCATHGADGPRFLCTAAASSHTEAGIVLTERVMLIERDDAAEPQLRIGPGCSLCPVTGCPARRGPPPVEGR